MTTKIQCENSGLTANIEQGEDSLFTAELVVDDIKNFYGNTSTVVVSSIGRTERQAASKLWSMLLGADQGLNAAYAMTGNDEIEDFKQRLMVFRQTLWDWRHPYLKEMIVDETLERVLEA